MIYSVNLIAILAPIILVQYGLSLFCLVKLVLLDLPRKKFWIWNFFILIVVGIGVVTFLVCYFKFRDKIFPRIPETEQPDAIETEQAPETDVQQTAETDADTVENPVSAAPEPPAEDPENAER